LVWKRQDSAERLRDMIAQQCLMKRLLAANNPAGLENEIVCIMTQEVPLTWYGSGSRGEYFYLSDLSIQGNNLSGLRLSEVLTTRDHLA